MDGVRETRVPLHYVTNSTHTIRNLVHPHLIKTQLEHDFLEKRQLNAIIGLAYVELGHEAFVGTVLSTLKVMNKLVGDYKVVMDHLPEDEGALVVTDAIRKKNFQMIHTHFGNQLVNDPEQAYRAVVGHVLRLRNLGNNIKIVTFISLTLLPPFNTSLQ